MLQVSELSGRHDRASFDCGKPELNNYLRQIAGQHVRKSLARVYVAHEESGPGCIVAFYSLNGCERNVFTPIPTFPRQGGRSSF